MARPLRIEYPAAWYHVMNRGRRGENIFSDKKDFESYLVTLQEASEVFDLRVAAYCLMSNHYHFLVQTPFGNLSRAMRQINGVYTQRFNRRHKIDGQLFRGRFKSILVEEDRYLLELLRYIHRNPVRAKICKSIKDYPWTSHQGYLSNAKKWEWLHKRFLLGMFADQPGKAKKAYVEFVNKTDSIEVTDFFSKKNLASIFGSSDFIEWIKGKFYQLKQNGEIPESRRLAPTIADIKDAVCQVYKVNKKNLELSKRGQFNEPRNLSIYLARKHSGLKLAEIGIEFGLEKYSSVSSIVMRTEQMISQDKKLKKRVEKLRSILNKSQAKI
ncbi:MAG: transposase [Desulfobulbaceae bacterium]|nr:transposase [Desulfobulbaceae bacterium]